MKRRALFLALTVLVAAAAFGQASKSATHKKSSSTKAGVPDKALMQRIWDAWATLDPRNAAQFYDRGLDDVFFDITPLKYNGWSDYEKGAAVLKDLFSSAHFTVNDDARVQSAAMGALGTATVTGELTTTKGQAQKMILRWTAVWANRNGKWLIIHEHVSVPTQ
jgi:ketosteroid isomerase-like protein